MNKQIKNRIAIVLDRSSSMHAIRSEVVKMFNEQVETIKKNAGESDTSVSLFTFSTQADDPVIWNAPLTKLEKLSEMDYYPNGWTALYDSVAMAIDKLSALKEASDPDCSFLMIVITDGEENKSTRHTGFSLSNMIKALQSTGRWTFTFLGANVDIEKMSLALNIPRGNVCSWSASSIGTAEASSVNALATAAYLSARSSGLRGMSNFYTDSGGTGIDPKGTNDTENKKTD